MRVDLQAALSGDPDANIDLRDRDKLNIYTYDEVKWRDSKVRIEGAVQRPGTYLRSEGMRLSDLLFAAGGLLPEAGSSLEVATCTDGQHSKITRVTVTKPQFAADPDLALADQDVVTVPTTNPSLRTPEVVFLLGEVANPGPYVLISPDEKLTDVIRRAGGLTRFADRNGLLFLRRRSSLEKPQQELDSDMILRKTRLFADRQFLTQLAKSGMVIPTELLQTGNKSTEELAKPVQVTDSGQIAGNTNGAAVVKQAPAGGSAAIPTNPENLTNTADTPGLDLLKGGKEQTNTAMGGPIKGPGLYGKNSRGNYVPSHAADVVPQGGDDSLPQEEDVARISVNLNSALDDSTSPDNLALRDGDRIRIPKVTNVVTVIGAVLHPHSFAAGGGKNAEYYIQRSGGFSAEASKGDVVVVRTNGDALPMRSVRSVMPGDIIVVPTTGLIDITRNWEKVGNVTKVVSDILSSVFVLTKI